MLQKKLPKQNATVLRQESRFAYGNVNLYIRQAEFDTQIPEFDTQISEFDTQIPEFDT